MIGTVIGGHIYLLQRCGGWGTTLDVWIFDLVSQAVEFVNHTAGDTMFISGKDYPVIMGRMREAEMRMKAFIRQPVEDEQEEPKRILEL